MVEGLPTESPIMDFLQKTKTQIAELSKRAANATKSGIETTTGAIQSKVVETKERSKKKKEAKIESIKSEIKDDGYIDAAPPMMILPEVDAQQFELLNSQNEAQIQIVEEMIRLSERLDMMERRITNLGSSITKDQLVSTPVEVGSNEVTEKREVRSGNVLVEVLNIMGPSCLIVLSRWLLERSRDSTSGYISAKHTSLDDWSFHMVDVPLFQNGSSRYCSHSAASVPDSDFLSNCYGCYDGYASL